MGRIEYEYPLFKVYYSNNSNNSNIRGNPGYKVPFPHSRGLLCDCKNRWIVCSSRDYPVILVRVLVLEAASRLGGRVHTLQVGSLHSSNSFILYEVSIHFPVCGLQRLCHQTSLLSLGKEQFVRGKPKFNLTPRLIL